ncbi:NAD(+)/NADH kinase [Parasporobacterium paucivorans]|uniref:NAD kinase n=1 Tax=Parasporobacterium paucivorans DSM 15970 TaxID=1122934 RepID=A0A1M6FAR4_9FIRM|nr:NAD(+)/NADH kinase [Parasporobacterium paucivorans]SHI94699.1 NAD+ kinase [Parasporobacterium paucivorans DSM 15970]
MNSFFVVTNPIKDPEFKITDQIEKYLKDRGASCTKSVFKTAQEHQNYDFINPDEVPEKIQCILVIGGDGTLIHAAKEMAAKGIPVLGINFGNLGYLAEVEKNNIGESLDRLLKDEYHIEQRMMLEGKILRNDSVIAENIALNDIVINRCGSLRIIGYKIYVNGQLLNQYNADGIIVSTPTGTTGYNLSAGGPIAQPTSSIIVVTPICAHTLNSRSIVFSEDVTIEIEIMQDKNLKQNRRILVFDGENDVILEDSDRVIITKADLSAKIIKLNKMSFLELLGKKMR